MKFNRHQRVLDAEVAYDSKGGSYVCEGAAMFVNSTERHSIPKGQQQHLLNVINDLWALAEKEFAKSAGSRSVSFPPCPVPKDLDTAIVRSSAIRSHIDELQYEKISFSTENIQINQKECHVYLGDLEQCLQSLLNDPRINHQLTAFPKKGQHRTYCDQHGNILQGPELWHGQRWKDLERTIPDDSCLLFLIFHSDKTASLSGTRYPVRVQIGNIPYSERIKDHGSRIVGFGPLISIMRERGCKHHRRLSEFEGMTKAQIYATFFAHMVAATNEIAKQCITFSLHLHRGDKLIPVYLRCGLMAGDYEEKKALLGIKGYVCARCDFLSMTKEACSPDISTGSPDQENYDSDTSEGPAPFSCSTETRPFMSVEHGMTCATARQRTVSHYAQQQAAFITALRCGATKASVNERAKGTGVAFNVQCMLQRASTLMPHEVGAPYSLFATDLLHSLNLGVARKLVMQINALMLSFKKGSRKLGTAKGFKTGHKTLLFLPALFSSFPSF